MGTLFKLVTRILPSTIQTRCMNRNISPIIHLDAPFLFLKTDIQRELISNLSLTSIFYKSVDSTDTTAALNNRKIKKARPYSTEENEKILKYVKKYGATWETWKMLAKEIDRPWPENIRKRYENYLKIKDGKHKQGKFTPEEDQIILNNVERHGCNLDTFRNLAIQLVRIRPVSIKRRHEFLTFNKEKKQKMWTSSDNKKLLEVIINLKGIKPRDISTLRSVKESDFESIAKELQRTTSSCYCHYNQSLLPVLKTHILGLPQSIDWIRELLDHIVDTKTKSTNDLDYFLLCQEMFPGQTPYSLDSCITRFLNLSRQNKMLENTPLCDIISDKLSNPSPQSILVCEKKRTKKLQYAEDIVEIYESII